MPELRQLKQRIGMICSIPPMTRAGTRNYIRTRLRLAGARDLGLFQEEALQRISDYAEGIPRVVNTVCDHCLLIGYADQPSVLQVVVYGITLTTIFALTWAMAPRAPAPHAGEAAAAR